MSDPTQPPKKSRKSKRSRAALFFLRGLVTLLPVVLTVFVIVTVVNFVSTYVTGPINRTIYWSLESNGAGWSVLSWMGVDPYAKEFFHPDSLELELREMRERDGYDDPAFQAALANFREDEETFLRDLPTLAIDSEKLRSKLKGKVPPVVGLGLSLVLVLWLGWIVGGFFGRRIVGNFDKVLNAIPVVRSVYPYAKQLVEFFLSENELEFDTVVAVPYPSKGLWSIGFVTNKALKTAREVTGQDLVAIFVPSSPMPMTGYTIFVDISRLIPLPISVDEALRVTVSGGVLLPPHEYVETLEGEIRQALANEKPE